MALAVEVGLKLPQSVLPQATVQLTPPFLVSLVTVAAIPAVLPTVMEVGGVKPGVKVTTIGGTGELELPQATKRTQAARQASKQALRMLV
jgi:hypothetical protein